MRVKMKFSGEEHEVKRETEDLYILVSGAQVLKCQAKIIKDIDKEKAMIDSIEEYLKKFMLPDGGTLFMTRERYDHLMKEIKRYKEKQC